MDTATVRIPFPDAPFRIRKLDHKILDLGMIMKLHSGSVAVHPLRKHVVLPAAMYYEDVVHGYAHVGLIEFGSYICSAKTNFAIAIL